MTEVILDPHEEGLIRNFIHRSKRHQFLRRVANPKTRQQQLDKLNHFYDLDERYARLIPSREQHPEAIYHLLRGKGAPDICHVMGNGDLDGRDLSLREAIEGVLDYPFGQFISCIPGQLGFFQDEDPGQRYILERRPS